MSAMKTEQPDNATGRSNQTRSVDVIIVGAGLSGIGAACRLRQRLPERDFLILESRDAIGGTWDLFRYPGVRSDSDMHSFSYPFRPWTKSAVFASGDQIRTYICSTAAEYGVKGHIHFGCRVTSASWSSESAAWTVEAQTNEASTRYSCGFLYLCTGYYDYDTSYQPEFCGLAEFCGSFVAPQFWPSDLTSADRDVVVIGSGATAVTLAPALARAGARVTMLQRSPSYIAALPSVGFRPWLGRVLPQRVAHRLRRFDAILRQQIFWEYCRWQPVRATELLRRAVAKQTGWPVVEQHFTPRYRPWDQRLCVAPDGDLFSAIGAGTVTVMTDQIDRFESDGIRLASGRTLRADVIVSATGLVLRPAGGIALRVDSRRIDLGEMMTYRGMMIDGVPNLVYTLGYVNSSWTLRSDMIARWVCRFLRHLQRRGYGSGTPSAKSVEQERGLFPLNSGYLRRSRGLFPRQGSRDPWRIRQNYLVESILFRLAPLGWQMIFTRRQQGANVSTGPIHSEPVGV
jgi:cation diffusion facilitator CzcD-associated flavoprotein CzcO